MKLSEVRKKRKKPYTNAELFSEICKTLELPDILDYAMATSKVQEVKSYEMEICNDLNYGGSEGIYLCVGFRYYDKERRRQEIPLGTFKTLDESREAMQRMAILLADFIDAESTFVSNHLDDFEWTGFTAYGVNDDGETTDPDVSSFSFTVSTYEKAKALVSDVSFKAYPAIMIIDNATGKKTFVKMEKDDEIYQ